jgi:hypothetical protein
LHPRIQGRFQSVAEPPGLPRADHFNARPNDGGRFFRSTGGQCVVFHRRRLDVDIDAVEQWPRNPLPVAFDLSLRTAALALGVAVLAARK